MTSQVKWRGSMADRLGVHRLAGWVRRSLDAMRADLAYVDSGSLDVLLYCPDELHALESREVEVD